MTSKFSSTALRAVDRRAYVLSLRRDNPGMTFREINRSVIERFGVENLPKGYDERQTWRDIHVEMKRIVAQKSELAEMLWYEQLDIIEQMIRALWPRVLSGSTNAASAVNQLLTRQARLLGLDAPTKIAQTDVTGEKTINPYADMPDEELNDAIRDFIRTLPGGQGEVSSPFGRERTPASG